MGVPSFKSFFPVESELNPEQREFFQRLKSAVQRGKYPPVEGQISYLFILAYDLLAKVGGQGYESLYDQLLDLAEGYSSEKYFSSYCKLWSYDCLLATKQYDRFLELSEPETLWGTEGHSSNTRLNVQFKTNRLANSIDLFKMFDGSVDRFSRDHETVFRDAIIECADKEASTGGAWFDRFFSDQGPSPAKYQSLLFTGAPVSKPSFPEGHYAFYASRLLSEGVRQITRDAENAVRESLDLPRIGEGWISETVLYTFLRDTFPETQVIHHGRPDWLGKQHFDIWFPHWRIAVEYHGKQHFEPVDFFGGEEGFASIRLRDARKTDLSHTNKIDLIVVDESLEPEHVAEKVRAARRSRLDIVNKLRIELGMIPPVNLSTTGDP